MAGFCFKTINQAERDWIARHLKFAEDMNVDVNDADHVAHFYDMLMESWVEAPADSRADPNVLINSIGSAFGEHLVRKASMRWVIATDDYGTDLAVHGTKNDFLLYPANVVAKRWVKRDSGAFISGMVHDIVTRTNGS